MWPIDTLAASMRTDTSPPKQGGFFIGTPHSPSALALRSRPPHSPLSPRPPAPFACASALAPRRRTPPSPTALAFQRNTQGLPCPRTPAALRVVGSASAACASSRYSRCGMTLRAPVAFSLRHPALCLWRCYAQGFAAPRAGVSGTSPATRRVGLALIVPPSALALVFRYLACHPLAHHHRFGTCLPCGVVTGFSGSSLCPRL